MTTKTKRAVKIKRTAIVFCIILTAASFFTGVSVYEIKYKKAKAEDKCVANFISSGVHRAQIETRNGYCYLAEGVIL